MRTQTNLAEHPEAMEGLGEFTEVMPDREEEEQAKRRSPQLELPVPAREGAPVPDRDKESDRGVMIIDLLAD